MTASGPTVTAHDETATGVAELDRWSEVARSTLTGEGVTRGHLDLIFVDPDAMTELNREHMGQDRPTDVLAFPLDGELGMGAGDEPGAPGTSDDDHESGPPLHLGDVVLCPQVAQDQAPDHCGHYEAELSLLVVHGVLHVLGHDHAEADERQAMQDRERHHLARYAYGHPGDQ